MPVMHGETLWLLRQRARRERQRVCVCLCVCVTCVCVCGACGALPVKQRGRQPARALLADRGLKVPASKNTSGGLRALFLVGGHAVPVSGAPAEPMQTDSCDGLICLRGRHGNVERCHDNGRARVPHTDISVEPGLSILCDRGLF